MVQAWPGLGITKIFVLLQLLLLWVLKLNSVDNYYIFIEDLTSEVPCCLFNGVPYQ